MSKLITYNGKVLKYGTTDPDALLFLTNAGITDALQRYAVNQLVIDLKAFGVWSLMKAVYPFVGGTASAHKFNLKDPRDLDAAFRLQFFGGWVHTNTGALPNGTNAYADSFLIPETNLLLNSSHTSLYSRTNIQELKYDLGTSSSEQNYNALMLRGNSSNARNYQNDANTNSTTVANSNGFFNGVRQSASVKKLIRNGVTIDSNSIPSNSLSSRSFFLGAINYYGFGGSGAGLYSSKEQAFASIGDGLTDTQAANLYTAVQTFQTTLNRQV